MSKRQAAKALRELLRLQSTGVPQRTFTVATPAAAPILGSQGLGKLRDVREVAPQQTVAASALAQPVDETTYVPDTVVDAYGAVSVVSEGTSVEQDVYKNIDGHRFEDGRYAAFISEITKFIPEVGSRTRDVTAVTEVRLHLMASWFAGNASADVTCPGPVLQARQFTDPVRTFAYGTDASFYRLNPKLVVKVHTEDEIRRVLPIARRLAVPVTFRAAGTSLSGQAITDSVLLKLSHTGKNFRNYTIHVSQPLLCACLVLQAWRLPSCMPQLCWSALCGPPFWNTCFLAVCTAYSPGLSPPHMHGVRYVCHARLSKPAANQASLLCRGMATRSPWSLA